MERHWRPDQDPASGSSPEAAHSEARRNYRSGTTREEQAGEQQQQENAEPGGGGGTSDPPEILKIMYTNIQSVFYKINELTVYAVDQSPDIILLTETCPTLNLIFMSE